MGGPQHGLLGTNTDLSDRVAVGARGRLPSVSQGAGQAGPSKPRITHTKQLRDSLQLDAPSNDGQGKAMAGLIQIIFC
ncbi:hypothetical protein GCM10010359_43420 [Streptomyces morookaense]|nr:hypothetical protein GCM10010359_43420 [Streptomyces morookaense]